jgi:hypothetical protein
LRYRHLIAVTGCLFIAACAGGKGTSSGIPGEYVEIPNPMQTMSKDAPATIWVPKSAEKGVPRGSVLMQEGVQKAKEEFSGKESSAVATTTVPVATAAPVSAVVGATITASASTVPAVRQAHPSVAVKKMIAVLETGNNGLSTPFSDQIKELGVGVPVDVGGTGGTAFITKESERPAFAGELWKENTASVLVVVSAPDGVGVGKTLIADIYDGIEKTRLRRVSVLIAAATGADKNPLAAPCAELALRMGDVINLTPWYGRVFAVEGERVYINAGRESGLQVGRKLKIYRGGKVIAGIGFDPGKEVTSLEISGFVGTNGSYGVVKDGQSITISDTVSIN